MGKCQQNLTRFSMPSHNSRWNLNSSWSKRKIKTRDCIRGICSKKAKTTPSAEMMMANVFWKALGIIFIDFLQEGKTITGLYYALCIIGGSFEWKKIKEKFISFGKKKSLFHPDKAYWRNKCLFWGLLKNHVIWIVL